MKETQGTGSKERAKRRKPSRRRGDGGNPDSLLIAGIRVFLFFYFLRFRLTLDKKALCGLTPPYILVANHGSNLDAFFIARSLNPCHMNFVSSAYFYRFRFLRYLLGRLGAIPKARTQNDLTALRLMRGSLQSGRILMVFPEGRRSMEGRGSRFPESMAKFAKRSGVPVVAARINGSYRAWPRWAEHARPGPISVSYQRLAAPEELKTMPVEELHRRMQDALQFDDYANPAGSKPHYRCKRPADGMERLLHLCPDCRSESVMVGQGRRIRCSLCGAEAELDKSDTLVRRAGTGGPWPDIPSWYRIQRAVLVEKMKDPTFVIRDGVQVRRIDSHLSYRNQQELQKASSVCGSKVKSLFTVHEMGNGHAILSPEELMVTILDHKENADPNTPGAIHFPICEMDMLPVSLGHHLEICDSEGVYWQLTPDHEETVVRFEQYTDICLYGEEPLV